MVIDESIASLRHRMSALVEQESVLLTRAFELSRSGGDRSGVDALFAQVQAIQVERNSLKKRIGSVLGTHRLHAPSEVWQPGVYDFRRHGAAESVRVRIQRGPLGLQVVFAGQAEPARIESLEGSFDGPLAVDDDAAHRDAAASQAPAAATVEAPRRRARRKPTPGT